MTQMNRRIVLASRPQGEVRTDNFRLEEAPLAELAQGRFRVRNLYLSIDPYMRGRMNDAKSYVEPQPLDEVMLGGAVGEVVETKHGGFAVGESSPACSGGSNTAIPTARACANSRKRGCRSRPISASPECPA